MRESTGVRLQNDEPGFPHGQTLAALQGTLEISQTLCESTKGRMNDGRV